MDINGDGLKDLVTGKRWWAHGPKGDADPNAPAVLYWFEAKKDKDGIITFTPHEIDDDSGIGTQFAVADVNGDGLLGHRRSSNKKGVVPVRAGAGEEVRRISRKDAKSREEKTQVRAKCLGLMFYSAALCV